MAFWSRVQGSCECFFCLRVCFDGLHQCQLHQHVHAGLCSSGTKLRSSPEAWRLLLPPGLVLERGWWEAEHLSTSQQHRAADLCRERLLAPGGIAPAVRGARARTTQGHSFEPGGKSSQRQAASKPNSSARLTASTSSPRPLLVKCKGEDETCCFFRC